MKSTFKIEMSEGEKQNRDKHAQSIYHKAEHLKASQQIYTGEESKTNAPLIQLEESDIAEIQQHQLKTVAEEG